MKSSQGQEGQGCVTIIYLVIMAVCIGLAILFAAYQGWEYVVVVVAISVLFILFVLVTTFPACKSCGKRFRQESKKTDLCPACRRKESEKKLAEVRERLQHHTDVPENNPNEKYVPFEWHGRQRDYYYENVKLFIPKESDLDFTAIDPGDDVRFVQEPWNQYDSRAVRVECLSKRISIGYVYRGKLQDMINDFLEASLPILSHISLIEDEARRVELFIAFYRTPIANDDEENPLDDE